jgi:cob(I)alamin adenosyltransferase
MKIATKTGDGGTTGLLFGQRLSKNSDVFEAIGDLDELSSFIGLAKLKANTLEDDRLLRFGEVFKSVQLDLIKIMGELNCETGGQLSAYLLKFGSITESSYSHIDDEVSFLQDLPELKQTDWVLYGKTEVGALCDICSKVARRAERSLYRQNVSPVRDLTKKYVNRLSDFFYLVARLSDYLLLK